MRGYRGRGNYRNNTGSSGGRYFHVECPPPSTSNCSNRGRYNLPTNRTTREHSNSNQYNWRNNNQRRTDSSPQGKPALLPTPPAVVKSVDNFFTQQPPPLFVHPVVQPQTTMPPLPMLDDLPVRPGPNATKKHFSASSPATRLRQSAGASSSTANRQTSGNESLHEAAKRKAFDAKRFKTHSESEGDNQHIVFSDQDERTSSADEQATKPVDNKPRSGMEEAAEKTRVHIAAVDSELLTVDGEINRLQAKRDELIKQRASLTDILSTLAPSSSSSDIASSRVQTPQSLSVQTRLPIVSPKIYEAASSSKSFSSYSRPEVQCPEISTHSQMPISPENSEYERQTTIPSRQKSDLSSSSQALIDTQTSSSVTSKRKQVTPDTLQTASSSQENVGATNSMVTGTLHLAFRDVDSGFSSRGIDDDSLIVTCFESVSNDTDLLLIGNKSGHVCKYSIQHQQVTRKEFIFRKPVTALCGVVSSDPEVGLRIFVGSSDGDYRCYNSMLSEVISQNRFGWGVCCIRYLLNHVYIGIGNGLISIICPSRGVVLERFSSGCSFIYDIEALQESARDTIVCSLKSSDHLSVRDAADGLQLRSVELPRLPFFSENAGPNSSAAALKQVNAATSPLACTHLACAAGFIFGCQANGQILAVAPGDKKATVVANLDSRPMALSVVGFNSSNGIYVAVITADAIVRVFLVSSSMPVGAVISKKRRSVGTHAGKNKQSRVSSSSDEEDNSEVTKTPITFYQVFHASMASQGWSLRLSSITSSGLICLISYQTNTASNAVIPPWVLEIFAFPKMLMGDMS